MLRVFQCVLIAIAFYSGGEVAWGADFTPITGWDEQLYPSFLVSTASVKEAPWIDSESPEILGDRGGMLGVSITSPGDETPIKVTVTCNDIMEPTTFSGTLPEDGVTYLVFPKIKYRYSKLAEFIQATPVAITFRVQVGDEEAKDVTEETSTVTVRPINDCPFIVLMGEQKVDISMSFAAYVNEQHPFLDKVLRECLDRGYVESFSGYQGGEAEVIRQVYALWDTLVARDVRYSSITATSVAGQTVASQHVRLLEESLNNFQANCVDGSVLMASLLRKIGIEPFLVMVPGHCYMGFYLDAKKTTLVAMETTLLGSTVAEGDEYAEVEVLENSVDEDNRDPTTWASFSNAISVGSNNFEEAKQKFDEPDNNEYMLIDISQARKQGVLPIAFRGKSEFLGVQPVEPDDSDPSNTDDGEEGSDKSKDTNEEN
ncbi:MAG: hypothetical protein U0929_16695 [Planctomycetaceae bacterium]